MSADFVFTHYEKARKNEIFLKQRVFALGFQPGREEESFNRVGIQRLTCQLHDCDF